MLDTIAYYISHWNRRRKWNYFSKHFNIQENTRILDVGYTDIEYSSSDNFLEKQYPYSKNITALGIEEPTQFKKNYPDVNVVVYDGKAFPFKNKIFDIVWSNAVIEHVGNKEKQLYFLQEMLRVGNKIYMTTPNKYFPIEVHTRIPFLHIFLPKKLFDSFLQLIGKSWACGDYMHLLSVGDIKRMCKKLSISKSTYHIHKNRIAGLVVDFVIIIDASNTYD